MQVDANGGEDRTKEIAREISIATDVNKITVFTIVELLQIISIHRKKIALEFHIEIYVTERAAFDSVKLPVR